MSKEDTVGSRNSSFRNRNSSDGIPSQPATGKPGTFNLRKAEAIKKGNVSPSDTQVQAIRRFEEDGVGAQNLYRPSTHI